MNKPGCTCVPHPESRSHIPPHPFPQGHPSAPALSTLSHASNLNWRSVSHMVIYMFQCYSFNLYAEYIMRNTGLEEAQAGIKSARRNINNLRYADDTIFTAESEEELKSLLMKVKEEPFPSMVSLRSRE